MTTPTPPSPPGYWAGLVCPYGIPNANHDLLVALDGPARTRPLPLPFQWQPVSAPAHEQASVVGLIDEVWEGPGGLWARGHLNLDAPIGREFAEYLSGGYAGWVSPTWDMFTETVGFWRDDQLVPADMIELAADCGCPTCQADMSGVKPISVYTDWRLISVTAVSEPAYAEAHVRPYASDAETTAVRDSHTPATLTGPSYNDRGLALVASVVGDTSLSWAERDHAWDGPGAAARVAAWADHDPARMGRAFLYRDSDADPATQAAYKLGFADVIGGELRAVFRGLSAAAGRLDQAQVPTAEKDRIRTKITSLYKSAARAFDDPSIVSPFMSARVQAILSHHTAAQRLWDQPCRDCLVAATAPIAAPHDWFRDPGLTEPTPMTITDDGRIYGHAGLTGVSHRGYAGFGRKPVFAPKGARIEHLKAYRVSEGHDIAVMPIVMGTDHASTDRGVSVAQVRDHYAHTGAEVAYVRAGEDRHGYWVAGALLPGLSDEAMVQVRGMTLSGDWRETDGGVEFIVALAVPVPGIPVVRKTDADGRILALVAAATPAPLGPALCHHAEDARLREIVRAELLEQRAADVRVGALVAARARILAGEADRQRTRMGRGA